MNSLREQLVRLSEFLTLLHMLAGRIPELSVIRELRVGRGPKEGLAKSIISFKHCEMKLITTNQSHYELSSQRLLLFHDKYIIP